MFKPLSNFDELYALGKALKFYASIKTVDGLYSKYKNVVSVEKEALEKMETSEKLEHYTVKKRFESTISILNRRIQIFANKYYFNPLINISKNGEHEASVIVGFEGCFVKGFKTFVCYDCGWLNYVII